MKQTLTLLTTLLLTPLAALTAADFVLIDQHQGLAPAPIIIFKDAPPRLREAAVTLADYLEKVSGARPELIRQRYPDKDYCVLSAVCFYPGCC